MVIYLVKELDSISFVRSVSVGVQVLKGSVNSPDFRYFLYFPVLVINFENFTDH